MRFEIVEEHGDGEIRYRVLIRDVVRLYYLPGYWTIMEGWGGRVSGLARERMAA